MRVDTVDDAVTRPPVRRFPMFVPFGPERLAAVLELPPVRPRGLVVFVQGAGGAPRSHRYRWWTQVASRLAERGIASVRMDYHGIGDSTGTTEFGDHVAPLDEVLSVARTAMLATGIERLGVVATCRGNGTALRLAATLDERASAACILPKGLHSITRPRRAGSIGSAARRLARRVLRPETVAALRDRGGAGAARFIPEVERLAEHGHLLFVHGGTEATQRLLRRGVAALAGRLPATAERVEVRLVPAGRATFEPLDMHRPVLDAVVEFMDRTMPEPVGEVVAVPELEGVPTR
jgi:pimeloyl-ACP methyl ester carboxylesterase